MSRDSAHGDGFVAQYIGWPHRIVSYVTTPWVVNLGPFPKPIDWSPPKGERIGGVPPWQGGYLLERASMTLDRVYFPQATVVLDVQLLTRPPEHAPTLAEAIRALCDGHGEAS